MSSHLGGGTHMRILSWNLNGLNAKIRNHDFDQFEHLWPLDIICFQETRTRDRPVIFNDYFHFWYPSIEKKGYSGTMTLTMVKPDKVLRGIGIENLDREGRVLTVDMGNIFVVNVYVPNSQGGPDREDYRRAWDDGFRAFITSLMDEKPVIICGDFNATMSREDIYMENARMDLAEMGYMSDERAGLYKLIENGFTDAFRHLHPKARNAFTWWTNRNYKRQEDRGWRLDYFFVSDEIVDKVSQVVIHQEVMGSDHCPIVLDCDIADQTYYTQYKEVMKRQEEREAEERKLTLRWAYRKRHLKEYKEKLVKMQAGLTANAKIRNHDVVRQLTEQMLDDIKLKCLAVDKVATDAAPPGTDNVKWKTDADRMRAVDALDWRTFHASPMRLIEIKNKATGKIRRSGILTYHDKAMAVLLHWIFSPIEEACADLNSFAFRPGRTRQDMILAVANLFTGFDAPELYVYIDVKGYYSNLQHKWIMRHVPLPRNLLETLLNTGQIFEGELFPPSDYGISEGSPLSPDIANYSLDGLQGAIYRALYGDKEYDRQNGAMVRYADDVVVAVRTNADAKTVIAAVKDFLKKRGLVIQNEKSKLGCISDGFTIVGISLKKEVTDMVIRPTDAVVQRFVSEIHEFIIGFKKSQRELIDKLNQKLRGWAAQYRFCDAYDAFRTIDAAVHTSLLESAMLMHPKIARKKLQELYWYIDDKDEMWYTLPKDRSVRVVHLVDTLLVSAKRSNIKMNPYFSKDYFAAKKKAEEIDRINAKYRPIWDRQEGKCLYCGRPMHPDQPKRLVIMDHRKPGTIKNQAYVHEICIQSDVQFISTLENVESLTDFDVREMLERITSSGTVVRDTGILEDSKYMKLYEYFGTLTAPKVMLKFSQIEEILGFKLAAGLKRNRTSWYHRKGEHNISDAFYYQGYKLARFYKDQQKIQFVAMFEDAERVVIPPEITSHKIPRQAKHEIEHYLQSIIRKYGLADDDIRPSNHRRE